MNALFFDLIFVDISDVLSIVVSCAVVSSLLVPLIRGSGPLDKSEWMRVRFAIYSPIAVLTIVALFTIGIGFGVFRLIYHVGATVYPLVGVLLILVMRSREKEERFTSKGRANVGFAMLMMSMLPLALWGTFVEPRWLDVTTTEVRTDAPDDVEPIRIVILSDVQTDRFGEYEERVLRETNALKPDLVLLPGDVMQVASKQAYKTQLVKARSFLSRIDAKHGVFMVQGDTESDIDAFRDVVTVLFNQTKNLEINGRIVVIGGSENNYHLGGSERTIRAVAASDAELKIAMAHRPYTVTKASESKIDLLIAGHSHGGQIAVPFVGPPITASQVDRHVAAGGLSSVDGRKIYVSRGIGLERMDAPRVRLNCRPELALLLVK